MRAGRPEAFDLLSKFVAERTLLECRISLPILSARLRARLVRFNSDSLHLVSDDTTSELSSVIPSAATFEYLDAREIAGAECFEGVLAIVFRASGDGPVDSIVLSELIAP